jgi:hypothetical protein
LLDPIDDARIRWGVDGGGWSHIAVREGRCLPTSVWSRETRGWG